MKANENGTDKLSTKVTATITTKRGLAEMLKGGVIMDVVDANQARLAEAAGAVAVMALERVPAGRRLLLDGREVDAKKRRADEEHRAVSWT